MLSSKWPLALVLTGAIVPLWLPAYLPLVDLPQHAAQIAALRALADGHPLFAGEFTINWFTPYLAGYLLLYALSAIMPIAIAAKVLVSAYIVAFPLATASLLRAAGGDARLAVLSIPAAFGVAYYWGFISYMVAVPVALWVLAVLIRGSDQQGLRHVLMVVSALTLLFFCHAITFGVVGIVAAGLAFVEHAPRWRALGRAWFPLLLSVPIPLAWVWLTASQDTEVQAAGTDFGLWISRAFTLLAQPGGQDSINGLGILLTLLVVLGPLALGAQPSKRLARWLPFVLVLMLAMFMPSIVFDAVLVSDRIGSMLVPMWLIVWEVPRHSRRVSELVTLASLATWIWLSALRYDTFAEELASARAVIGEMRPGNAAASLVIEHRSPMFGTPLYLHFPAWYQAEHFGRVDFNFADFYGPMVRYRSPRGGRVREGTSWYPLLFEWDLDGGDRYRYFIIRAPFDPGAFVFKEHFGKVTLIKQSGWWWLYESTNHEVPLP